MNSKKCIQTKWNNGIKKARKERKRFYPASWSYETKEPFTHAQVDTKDILDKATLGTEL